MATLALGAVGAGIGFGVGGPAGARLGFQVGAVVGSIIDQRNSMPKTSTGTVSDLRIGGSAYSTPIPRGWGEFRTAGLLVWAAEDSKGNHLKKHSKKVHGGGGSGGGGGGGEEVYYTSTFAVKFCQASFYARDPANPLGGAILYRAVEPVMLWADDVVVYDESKTNGILKKGEDFFWYSGTENQPPDPTVVAKSGGVASKVNAFRGDAYGVMVDMNLKRFGNRVPNWSGIMRTVPVTLGDVFSDMARMEGLQPSEIDVAAAQTPVLGFQEPNRAPAQNSLEPLTAFYGYDVIEVDGKIGPRPRGGDVVATIPAGDLGASSGTPGRKMARKGVDPLTLPGKVTVEYFDKDLQHQSGEQSEVNQSADTYNVEPISLPITETATGAQAAAARRIDSRWAELGAMEFTVPLRWLRLAPGDPVVVPIGKGQVPTRVRLTEVNHGPISEIRCTAVPENQYATAQVGRGATGGATQSGAITVVPSVWVAWSGTEVRNEDQESPGFYVGATGDAGWSGGQVWYTVNGTDWIAGPYLQDPAAFGVTTGALGDSGAAPIAWDDANAVDVDLSASGGSLASTSDSAIVDGGDNHALVGSEILGFGAADLSGANAYTLSHLRRGERSTSMTGHVAGERFVALTPALGRVSVGESLVGATVQVKVVSDGQTLADVPNATRVVIAGRTLTAQEQVLATLVRPRFVAPAVIFGGEGDLQGAGAEKVIADWATVDLSGAVPKTAQAVILEWRMREDDSNVGWREIQSRANAASPTYTVGGGDITRDDADFGNAGQVTVPLDSGASYRRIDFRVVGPTLNAYEVRLVGYWG